MIEGRLRAVQPILLLVLVLGVMAVPVPAGATPGTKPHRIGFLGNSTAALERNLVEPFRQGLRERGYVEGQDVVIEYRWAEGNYERFPGLIAELIGLKVDVIVTAGTPAALAVKRATTTIPVVMIAVGDPVGTGLIASLARPGGNVTGLTSIAADLEGKRLELLREVIPRLTRLSVLWNPASTFQVVAEREARAAAQRLQLGVHSVGVRAAGQFDESFEAIVRERAGALVVLADRLFLHERAWIIAFATRHRLPGVYAYRELVEEGGLMSFGPSYADMHRRAATYVDKILRGASPASLPVEQPAKFELIVNLKAAHLLGLTLPPAVLARADEILP